MEEKAINLNGLQVHYKVAGLGSASSADKPAILILHGWGSRNDRWVKVAELLSQNNFSVVFPDLPGFGKSDTPPKPWNVDDYRAFVEQFVQAIGLKEFYLLGHSFGGGVATTYTAKFPSQVKKLIVVAGGIIRRKTLKKNAFRMIARVVGLFSFLPLYGLFRKACYKYIIQKSDYPYTSGVMKETYKNVVSEDLLPYLSLIQTPSLIIWGAKDDVLSVKDAYIIHERLKGSKLEILPEGDHDIEQHMPKQLVATIATFLRPQK